MNFVLVVVLILLALAPAQSATNAAAGQPPASEADGVAREFAKLLAEDDAVEAEVKNAEQQIAKLKTEGLDGSQAAVDLRLKVHEARGRVRKAYENFLSRNPNHAQAHLAFGSFLADRQEETAAQEQWEKALELAPKNPDAYNNLAGLYSEAGKPEKAFDYYAKAIELNPNEARYYHNFGDSVYVLRKRAMEYYHLDEQQVYVKALELYSNAVRLDPGNFRFASDLAQTYYSLHPLPTERALNAWSNALKSAASQPEREGVYIHLARLNMLAARYAEARAQLITVTNQDSLAAKQSLLKRLDELEGSKGTNAPAREEKQ